VGALGAYVMRGRLQAITATAGFAGLSLVLAPFTWPLSYLSGATLALVVLVRGTREGLLIAAVAAAVLGLAGALIGQPLVLGLGLLVSLWLPTWLLAYTLRQSRSLSLTLLAAGGLGVAMVIMAFVGTGDPAAWWLRNLEQYVWPVLDQAALEPSQLTEVKAGMAQATVWMTGSLAAFVTLGLALGILIARRWQSMLYEPGAFAEEFRRLRLGSAAAWLAVVLIVLWLLGPAALTPIVVNVLLVLAFVFLFQGLAVVHFLVLRLKASVGWLVATYVLLGLGLVGLPHVFLLLAVAGLTDNWLNYRSRLLGGAS
jgi:hypothetical protein